MDVAGVSTVMSQSSLAQNVSLALTKKTIDTANESSQSLIKMMELSVNPNLGSSLDVRA